MSTKKIEFLADRRAAVQGSENSLRALRHLDAARAKLEVLQTARRQLKLDLKKHTQEHEATLAEIEELKLRNAKQLHELQAMQMLLDTQAKQIAQLQVNARRYRSAEEEGDRPALTVLALEKLATQTTDSTTTTGEQLSLSMGLIRRLWYRMRPGAGKSF